MKRWKNSSKKWLAGTLAAVLVCGSAGIYFCNANENKGAEAAPEAAAQRQAHHTGLVGENQPQFTGDETVYVIADAAGTTKKLIVSDKLSNGEYDQQNLEKELPVDMKITYTLDGKEITPEELAGQSGRVTMHFAYTNRQKESVLAGNARKELYVPFAVLTGTVLDHEKFTNVEVTNGKAVDDGDRTLVMGVALPGLKENLDVDSRDVDIPDYVEITADVTDFELAMTMSVATSEVFRDLDLDEVETLDDLENSMDDLQDAMGKLMDGSGELYDGVQELYEKSGELTDGIDELNDGAGKLKDGVRDLNKGAGDLKDGTETLKKGTGALKSGAAQLVAGLAELSGNSDTLRGGAAQVYASLLAQVDVQLEALRAQGIQIPALTQENWSAVLEQVIGGLYQMGGGTSLGELKATLASLDQMIGALEGAVPEAPAESAEVPSAQPEAEEETVQEETKQEEAPEEIPSEIADGEVASEEQTKVEQTTEEPQAQIQEKETILVKAAPQNPDLMALKAKRAALAQAISAIEALEKAKTSLGAYDTFYKGLVTYTKGVDTIYAQLQQTRFAENVAALDQGANDLYGGASQLKDGAGELGQGAEALKDGTGDLKDGGRKLRDGVSELRDGAGELRDGLTEFNDEGIKKLVDAVDGDLLGLVDNLRGTVNAARTYESFSGISGGTERSVKFIYKTAAIETEE